MSSLDIMPSVGRPDCEKTVVSPTRLKPQSGNSDTKDHNGTNTETTLTQEEEDDFPDGGIRAWTVLMGTMCCTFSTFGLVNSWGVFQSYYEQTILPDESPSNIAWIGSIQYSLVFFPGLITGRFFDMGHFRVPFMLASAVLVVSTLLVAHCTKYWHFLLCQGFSTGLAAGVMFGPTMGILGHWFSKRRGFALGMNSVGSSIGGTLLPIAARKLIPIVGFPWTMRILAFILLAAVTVANVAMRRRLPPKHVSGGFVNLAVFSSASYTVYCVSAFLGFAGIYTVLTYIDVNATEFGVSPEFSFYLVSIANAGSCFGRLLGGALTDRFGAINTLAPSSTAAALVTYLWPYAQTKSSVIAVAVLYGFFSGGYTGAFLAPVFALGNAGDVGRRTGMAMTFAAVGSLVGPPISGAIKHSSGSFKPVGYYAGTVILLAISMMLLTRYLVLRSVYGKF